jgi:hypothetical protein
MTGKKERKNYNKPFCEKKKKNKKKRRTHE